MISVLNSSYTAVIDIFMHVVLEYSPGMRLGGKRCELYQFTKSAVTYEGMNFMKG